ncbi:hypothetical protein CASFOL_013520 [Castilleja foliolosa]|uniref:Peptidase A1 domain-containing protein n=1 Tax=Castilleja foliolosa TaxID=1961234 RepID=A0ABD3DK74_9LAMI
MSFLWLLHLSLLFSSFFHLFSISSAKSITLSLFRPSPIGNRLDTLKYHTAASLSRAHHLKHTIQLYPRSYGGYSVSLIRFGTPPQNLSFMMDTGSSLVWFPCTTKYTCTHCNISKADPTFIPKLSSSFKIVTCNSPQCGLLFGPGLKCKYPTGTCGYQLTYELGNTTGLLVSESLTIPGLSVANFTAGCSISSADVPPGGVVGFGRSPVSLPSQLGLKAFSYCLVSHDFDDNTTMSSDLVLTTTPGGGCKRPSAKIQYTLFVSNPAFPHFYYVWLQNISIGGVHVKVPANYLALDAKGNGGTIVDSGTTVTQMEKPVFDLVFKELKRQVGNNYSRASNIEQEIGLKPCYNVGVDHKNKPQLPQLTFYFQGGVEMVLPLPNYFTYVDNDSSVVCMTIQNYGELERGPAIILGNYQQQDYYMEYDLENNRLGILQHDCKST